MTGAGIEPATLALKVRCSTTELPGLGRLSLVDGRWIAADDVLSGMDERQPNERQRRNDYCTVNGTDASVVSQVMTIDPPGPASFFLIAKVNCSTGVSSGRFSNVIRPRSAVEL